MLNKLKFRKEKRQQALIIFSLSFYTLLTVSCSQESQTSGKSGSELINKINAVHEQIMVQGNMSDEEQLAISSLCSLMPSNDGFSNYSPDDAILFKDVENAPIYTGCEGFSAVETKNCFKESIVEFITQEFNSSIAHSLGLTDPKQVAAFFIIDEHGQPAGMKIRDADVTIQAEIGRIFKKIPKITPATQDGINVAVLCSILVTYGSEVKIEFVFIPEGLVD